MKLGDDRFPEGMPRAGQNDCVAGQHVPLPLLLCVAVRLRSEYTAEAVACLNRN